MAETRLDADRMRRALNKTINAFGTTGLVAGRVQAIVMVNGREELFDIDGLVVEAVLRDQASAPAQPAASRDSETWGGTRTPPAGRGKIRLAAIDGAILQ